MSKCTTLKGRIALVYWNGWRYNRIVRVNGKRRIASIVVAEPSYEGGNRWGWNGPRHRIPADNFSIKGILFRRRVIPLAEFGGAA